MSRFLSGEWIMPPNKFKQEDITFSSVADLYVAELRKGNQPSVDDFARAFPHLADSIYRQFPSLLLLEEALSRENQWGDELPETLLGECRIESEIGRGAMGIVYRAFQFNLGRTVAVKVIPLQKSISQSTAARFELERRAMAKLDHPNIVPIYTFGSDDHYAFMVMKFIDGKSLDQLLHEATNYKHTAIIEHLRTDWNEFARTAAEVASGLQHAHSHGLVHRDIKPANLIVDNTGKIWITDFGLAKMTDYALSLSRVGDAVGTPRYMAPEQLRGNCDARSDVYSLGITLYELAAGVRVWDDKSFESITTKRNTLELPNIAQIVQAIPKDLAKIIMKACEFAPEKRYQSAKELQHVLERFAQGSRPSDRRGRRRVTDSEYRDRARKTVKIALAMGIAVVATTPVAFLYFREGNETKNQVLLADHGTFLPGSATPPATSDSSPTDVEPSKHSEQLLVRSNYLEKLAGIEEGNYEDEVVDFLKQRVSKSTEEFHLAEDEKEQIVGQVENVLQEMKNRQFTKEDMKSFVDGYRETVLPVATRIIGYVRVIDRSSLAPDEKQSAYATLRRFAKAIVNRQVPEDDARLLESILTQGRNYTITDLVNMDIPIDILRHWLWAIHNRMATLKVDVDNAPINLSPEIERALQFAQYAKGSNP